MRWRFELVFEGRWFKRRDHGGRRTKETPRAAAAPRFARALALIDRAAELRKGWQEWRAERDALLRELPDSPTKTKLEGMEKRK